MDFQAVVMAGGKGSRMIELTAKCPKALLPIGNRPMIWYPLNILQKNGFKDAIVVIPALQKNEIMQVLNSLSDIKIQLHEELIQPSNLDSGTADALMQIIKNREIKRNLLVLSCDLISDISLDPILALHYTYNPTVTLLFAPLPSDLRSTVVPGPKTKQRVERDLVGIDNMSNRLVFMTSEADCDDEQLTLKRHMLHQCPNFNLHSNLLDAHAYVFNKSVYNLLEKERFCNSLKGDLIPIMTRRQFANAQCPEDEKINCDSTNYLKTMSLSMKLNNDICSNVPSCYGFIAKEGFCFRANNLATYMYANQQVAKLWPSLCSDGDSTFIHSTFQKSDGVMVGADCFIGKNAILGSKSILKGSSIGHDCKIGTDVKLTHCVVMDKVTIGNSCTLQGCIIQREAILEEGCHLKNCVVATDQVPANTKSSHEIILSEGQFMELSGPDTE